MFRFLTAVFLLFACVSEGARRQGRCPVAPPPNPSLCSRCVFEACGGSINLLLPYPGNCTKFCVCDHLGAVSLDCPRGLEFDFERQVCTWPNPNGCSAHVEGCGE